MDRPVHGRRLAPPRQPALARAIAGAVLACACTAAHAQTEDTQLAANEADLTLLSLEDLMRIEVTSVSKRAEPLSDAAAAISVITGDEIRRAGARTLADALRLIPGMDVAATNAHAYAVSARGFNSTSSDKLEVLLDGRSVYTPLYSGVFWDSLQTYLPDIDRIEVIRGPGAALWGANAVNGVINIVTRPATETLGTAVDGAAGSQQRGYAAMRAGSKLGDSGAIRLYGLWRDTDRSERADGSKAEDGMRLGQIGFRSDARLGNSDFTWSGDFYDGVQRASGAAQQPVDYDVSGANLVARWSREGLFGGRLSVQGFYDHGERSQPTIYAETRDTFDLEAQHSRTLGGRHYLIYGAGFRSSRDRTGDPADGYAIIWDPARRTLQTWSAFAQDQIKFADDAVTLTLGTKFEYNDFTGFEFQPNVRIGWRLSPRLFTWASLARAVRTPNRLDADTAIFCPEPDGYPGVCGPGVFRVGNPDLDSEKLHALDGGLRWALGPRVSVDLALFYNRYSDLRSTEHDVPVGNFANELEADSFGSELSASWQAADALRLQASYALLVLDAEAGTGSSDTTTAATLEGSSPRHSSSLRASWQPAADWSIDALLRYVGRLDYYDVPAYTELNLRTAWRPLPQLELGLIGSNLLDERHPEWGRSATRSEVERAVLLEVRWEWR